MSNAVMVLPSAVLLRLFLAVFFSLSLHASDVSAWLFVGALIFIVWRYAIYRYGLVFPGIYLRSALVMAGFSFVYSLYGWMPSIESMVTLLVAGISLKLIEVQFQRDAYLLIFACFFLQSLHFLFDQTPVHYLAVLCCCFFTLYTQIYLNKNLTSGSVVSGDAVSGRPVSELMLAGKLMLLSLPLALFLFFVLPRLSPLWSISVPTESAKTGLSDQMSPGDIGRLGKSDELAFRVKFKSQVPDMHERYWRVLVLDHYDGKAWSQNISHNKKPVAKPNLTELVAADQNLNQHLYYEYDVISEASEKKWLYSLANVTGFDSNIKMVEGDVLRNNIKLMSPLKYSVTSAVHKSLLGQVAPLTNKQQLAYLQYPQYLNKQTQSLASQLWQASNTVPQFLARVEQYVAQGEFVYTLRPNTLSDSSQIDEFLFDSPLGFCAHYAGALTYMLRSVGVPSRIVLGYMGGEKNQHGDYYSVYQYDAHAWVEYWLDDKGWVRVDPTSWVSPDRIELGMSSAVKDEFVGFKTDSKWLKDMRHRFMSLNYLWQDWMLSYKDNKQQALLESIVGKRNATELVLIGLMIFAVVSLVLFAIFMWPLRRQKSPIEKIFDAYKQALRKAWENKATGYVSDASLFGLTHRQLGEQAVLVNVRNAKVVSELNRAFDQMLYAQKNAELNKQSIKEIKSLIKKLHRQ